MPTHQVTETSTQKRGRAESARHGSWSRHCTKQERKQPYPGQLQRQESLTAHSTYIQHFSPSSDSRSDCTAPMFNIPSRALRAERNNHAQVPWTTGQTGNFMQSCRYLQGPHSPGPGQLRLRAKVHISLWKVSDSHSAIHPASGMPRGTRCSLVASTKAQHSPRSLTRNAIMEIPGLPTPVEETSMHHLSDTVVSMQETTSQALGLEGTTNRHLPRSHKADYEWYANTLRAMIPNSSKRA